MQDSERDVAGGRKFLEEVRLGTDLHLHFDDFAHQLSDGSDALCLGLL